MRQIILKSIYFVPWILLSLAIIYVSNQEQIVFLNDAFLFEDKLLHFIAYFVYGLTIQLAIIKSTNVNSKKLFLAVILIGALFALSDEIHQYFVEGRSSDIIDWIADTLGILVSLLCRKLVLRLKVGVSKILQ